MRMMLKTPFFFLHGFLGSPNDWDSLRSKLSFSSATIPFSDALENTLLSLPQGSILVGYSMGGRIALQMQRKYPQHFPRLILLSAHLGLQTQEEKNTRRKIEEEWSDLMKTHSLAEFLELWYAQPLFHPFTAKKALFSSALQRRSSIDFALHKELFERYRLSEQEYQEPLASTHLVYGSLDLKYAKHYSLFKQAKKIEDAGHVVHLENEPACLNYLETFYADTRNH